MSNKKDCLKVSKNRKDIEKLRPAGFSPEGEDPKVYFYLYQSVDANIVIPAENHDKLYRKYFKLKKEEKVPSPRVAKEFDLVHVYTPVLTLTNERQRVF